MQSNTWTGSVLGYARNQSRLERCALSALVKLRAALSNSTQLPQILRSIPAQIPLTVSFAPRHTRCYFDVLGGLTENIPQG